MHKQADLKQGHRISDLNSLKKLSNFNEILIIFYARQEL